MAVAARREMFQQVQDWPHTRDALVRQFSIRQAEFCKT